MPSGWLALNEEHNQVEFDIPVSLAPGIVNNSKSNYKFKFDGLFDTTARQSEIFDLVAKETCDNALEGYNATVFAYGQTGSGKTFTITGGPDRYEDRGIIPRAISYLFTEFDKRTDYQYSVYASYLEIYNENGYDLLDPSHETKTLEELPRVSMMEDDAGNVHLKNLSLHHCSTEEDALNYLFLGDTNRAISETPMNLASSRSHCIFTLSLEARAVGSDTVRRSKLHLVDLAGSERVHKTNSTGQLLREATHINKSLHFLELCIKSLGDRGGGGHIPYRNSMMTNVLRDSLGGNCKTTMIATVNPEAEQTGETISTCRFSQRVACVKNSAIVNEVTDPMLIIQRLKSEIVALKAEIAVLKGEEPPEAYEDAVKPPPPSRAPGGASPDEGSTALAAEVKQLRSQLQQRDNEISILVNMVNKLKAGGGGGGGVPPPSAEAAAPAVAPLPSMAAPGAATPPSSVFAAGVAAAGGGAAYPPPMASTASVASIASEKLPVVAQSAAAAVPGITDPSILSDRERSLQEFLKSYPKAGAVESNRALLADMYAKAKGLGERVNGARSSINTIKAAIEARRVERAVDTVVEGKMGDAGDLPPDPEEERLRAEMDAHKADYHRSFQALREAKKDIERAQRVFEAGKLRLHSDFESWYTNCLIRAQQPQAPAPAPLPAPTMYRTSSFPAAQPAALAPTVMPVAAAARAPAPASTGNTQTDADIKAFYEAREVMLRRTKSFK